MYDQIQAGDKLKENHSKVSYNGAGPPHATRTTLCNEGFTHRNSPFVIPLYVIVDGHSC